TDWRAVQFPRMKRRPPKFARRFAGILAGIYLIWSLFVYFASLGSDAHAWWPLFLYFIIWPVGALWEHVSSACLEWLAVRGKSPARRCAAALGRDRGVETKQYWLKYEQVSTTKSPAQGRKQRPRDFRHGLLVRDPRSAPDWVCTLNDYIAGAFYIIVGTIWVWF